MDTMNALVWKGDGALSLERRPVPTLQGPRDAIVRVTRSTICTSAVSYTHLSVPAPPTPALPYDFSTSAVDTALFPFATWAKLMREVLSEQAAPLLASPRCV